MKQILIIEDDEFNCLVYKEILTNDFTIIDFAFDGQEGLDKFKEKAYDLLLVDIGLPKINGLQLVKLIREYELNNFYVSRTPIIIITANNIPGTQTAAIKSGVDAYLTKPFDIKELKNLTALYLQKNTIVTADSK